MTTLRVANYRLRLRFTSGGQTLPWLGPALKGVVGSLLKEQACRWPADVRQRDWTHCRGCPHADGCAYGDTFEPDAAPLPTVMPTAADGQRAVALASQFPGPVSVAPHDWLGLNVILIGDAACAAAGPLLEALAAAGRNGSLGPSRIRFEPAPFSFVERLSLTAADLPAAVDRLLPTIHKVRVTLTAPLFLRGAAADKRRHLSAPAFCDLVRGCLRTVGRAFDRFGDGPLEGVDFRNLKDASFGVRTVSADWRLFRQGHHSRRSGQRWPYYGVSGSATFADVPAAFLPWLVWGGRLGVGEHRVCGAGRWEVTVE